MPELFCKKTLNEIVPSARAILTEKLLDRKIKQEEIADLLNVTQPAISQYNKKLRGNILLEMKTNNRLSAYFDKLAGELLNGKVDINFKTCEICEKTRASGTIHKKDMTPFICLVEMAEKRDFHA